MAGETGIIEERGLIPLPQWHHVSDVWPEYKHYQGLQALWQNVTAADINGALRLKFMSGYIVPFIDLQLTILVRGA